MPRVLEETNDGITVRANATSFLIDPDELRLSGREDSAETRTPGASQIRRIGDRTTGRTRRLQRMV